MKVEFTSSPSITLAATVMSFVLLKLDLTLSKTSANLVIYSSSASFSFVKSIVLSFVVLKLVAIVFVFSLFVVYVTLYFKSSLYVPVVILCKRTSLGKLSSILKSSSLTEDALWTFEIW